MVKAWSVCVWLLLAVRPASPPVPFGGCIEYEHEYQTLAGDQLFFAVKPKSWLYVQGNNLKVYDRNKQLQELYLGATNEYHRFDKGRPLPPTQASWPTDAARLTCLSSTATILGYRCQMLQLVQAGTSTLVFYAPELHVNAADFSRCPSPGFYALLQATDGALPLRTISVDTRRDVTATTEAIAVQPMTLAVAEFTATAPAR